MVSWTSWTSESIMDRVRRPLRRLRGRVLLSFADPNQERAFVAGRTTTLVHGASIISALCICALVTVIVHAAVNRGHSREDFPTDIGYRSYLFMFWSRIFQVCGFSIALVCLRTKRLVEHAGPVVLEVMVMLSATLSMLLTVLGMRRTFGLLLGYSYAELDYDSECGSDAGILIAIDGIITGTHVGFSLRWHVLLLLDVTGPALYAFLVFAGANREPKNNSAPYLIILTLMVAAMSVGKHATERSEREAFLNVIKEKKRRCQAEYQLSRAEKNTKRPKSKEASECSVHSDMMSALSAPSVQVFDPLFQEGCDTSRQLGRIAEMGAAEHWLLQESEVEILRADVLGTGRFGVVMRGLFCGMMVAVKRPRMHLARTALERLPALCNEFRTLRHLRHPNIVGMHGVIIRPNEQRVAVVFELVVGVTLDKWLMPIKSAQDKWLVHAKDEISAKDPSPCTRYQVMMGVCQALTYMHTRKPKVVHGDIKDKNIMVQVQGEDSHPKILDFGLSRVLTNNTRPLGGTLGWQAPEVALTGSPAQCSADVYSFGRVLAFICTNDPPRQSSLITAPPPLPSWPPDCVFQPICKPLTKSCLRTEEGRRPSITSVFEELLRVPRMPDLVDVRGRSFEEARMIAGMVDGRLVNQSSSRLSSLPEDDPIDSDVSEQPEAPSSDNSHEVASVDFQSEPGCTINEPDMPCIIAL